MGLRERKKTQTRHHIALVAYTRQRVLADPTPTGLATDVQRHAEAAFALLDDGLGDYAPK